MDIHEKHETDLTRAERRQLEKEKLQSMDWKHKLEYIWDYYKPQIFSVIAIFAAIWFGFSWYENSKYETIMYAAVTDGYMNEDESEQMNREYKEFIGDQEKYHRVSIDTTVAIGSEDSQARYNATMKLNTIVAARGCRCCYRFRRACKGFCDAGSGRKSFRGIERRDAGNISGSYCG